MGFFIEVEGGPKSKQSLKQFLESTRIVGESPRFLKALENIRAIADANDPVIVTGETGTGKELVARAIHTASRRSLGPFVAVNCGTLQDNLLPDTLFGHHPGAFTDARSQRLGLMALADGGTLFLDEIDSLTRTAQVALLRVIQDWRIWPVGSDAEKNVNVRLLTATNASLDKLVAKGEFRPDLFYRLSVFEIRLPPLRERMDDILLLAEHFMQKHRPTDQAVPELNPELEAALLSHQWPGNVRELENVMIRITKIWRNEAIDIDGLGIDVPRGHDNSNGALDWEHLQLEKRRACLFVERQFLTRVMAHHQGNVTQAAIALGKERRQIGKLLKKHGLDRTAFIND